MSVRKAQHTDRVMFASRVAPRAHAGVADFDRNHWQLSIGITGNLGLESVAGFDRNQWQPSTGIRNSQPVRSETCLDNTPRCILSGSVRSELPCLRRLFADYSVPWTTNAPNWAAFSMPFSPEPAPKPNRPPFGRRVC